MPRSAHSSRETLRPPCRVSSIPSSPLPTGLSARQRRANANFSKNLNLGRASSRLSRNSLRRNQSIWRRRQRSAQASASTELISIWGVRIVLSKNRDAVPRSFEILHRRANLYARHKKVQVRDPSRLRHASAPLGTRWI